MFSLKAAIKSFLVPVILSHMLIRHLSFNAPTKFQIPATGDGLTAREIVTISRDLATDQATKFLAVLEVL